MFPGIRRGGFEAHSKQDTAIIYSHGLTNLIGDYSNIARLFAKEGYSVYLIDHLDGSCVKTKYQTKDDKSPKVMAYNHAEGGSGFPGEQVLRQK